jgi:hypothetical protein
MPKTGLYRIFDHQQPTEFLDRDAVGRCPIRWDAWLQSFAVSAWQRLGHPCGNSYSMGASVRLKTGIFHNIVRDEQMKANPGVLTSCARLPARHCTALPSSRRLTRGGR